jgi:hypothetical protein
MLFPHLGITAFFNLLTATAIIDDAFNFSPSETLELDQFWNEDTAFEIPSRADDADDCLFSDLGSLGKTRARGLCSDLPPSIEEVELLNAEFRPSIEASGDSYDVALLSSSFDSNPRSELELSVGRGCRAEDFQFIGKIRARNPQCKAPDVFTPRQNWDPDLDQGIYKQGHPDWEFLHNLEWAPDENNDLICPMIVVGRRYAVCSSLNEFSDVIGDGVTLRNCELCTWFGRLVVRGV